MKNLFLLTLLIVTSSAIKAQCIRIYVSENVKGVEIPIEKGEFEVTINDTLKKKLTTDKSGYLTRISLERGKYNVKLESMEFKDAYMKDVVVEESKSSNIVIDVFRLSAAEEKEKLEKEKKKLEKK
jgi:hypothetical protein